jgi:hypothetical protein
MRPEKVDRTSRKRNSIKQEANDGDSVPMIQTPTLLHNTFSPQPETRSGQPTPSYPEVVRVSVIKRRLSPPTGHVIKLSPGQPATPSEPLSHDSTMMSHDSTMMSQDSTMMSHDSIMMSPGSSSSPGLDLANICAQSSSPFTSDSVAACPKVNFSY